MRERTGVKRSDVLNIVGSYAGVGFWWWLAASDPWATAIAVVVTVALLGLNLAWLFSFGELRYLKGRVAGHKWWRKHLGLASGDSEAT